MGNAITVRDVGKVYHIYESPKDRLKEMLSRSGRKYAREFHALDGINLEVGHGEAVGIIGRNGSGKSTLLKIICGIVKPTTGEVETKGRISAILELGTGFNPLFTGRENMYLNGALMGFTKEEMDGRFQDIASFADIGEFMDQPVRTYSSGMYVRLAFACAVNVDPEILIVDEAISVGDVFFASKCFRRINDFREQGKTILLVSHNLEAIKRNCGRTLFIDKGKMAMTGASRDVVNFFLEKTLAGGEKPSRPAAPSRVDATGAGAASKKAVFPDKCVQKPNYNKNEFRYGSGKAYIHDYSMTTEDGRETISVVSGERLKFRYMVVYEQRVDRPVYGFSIKTKEGVVVYGINTWYEGMDVKPGRPGDRVEVEFDQAVNLAGGDYFITAGVADVEKDAAMPVDRRYDLAYLNVLPPDKSFGIANLFSKIKMSEAG